MKETPVVVSLSLPLSVVPELPLLLGPSLLTSNEALLDKKLGGGGGGGAG